MRSPNRLLLWTCSTILSHGTWNSVGESDAAQAGEQSSGGGGKTATQPASQPHIPLHSQGATGSLATSPVLSRCILLCALRCKVQGVPAGPRVQARQKGILGLFSIQRSPARTGSPIILLVTLQHPCLLSPNPTEARRPQVAPLRLGTGKTR